MHRAASILTLLVAASADVLGGAVLPSQDEKSVVAWGDGFVVARVAPDGVLRVEGPPGGPSASFSPAPGRNVSWPAAVAMGDRVFVAWVEGSAASSQVRGALVGPTGPAAAVPVSSSSSRWARFPSVSVAPDGELWIAWVDGSMETDNVVAAHGRDGRVGAPEVVSLPDASEDLLPHVSFDPSGTPVMVWAGLDGRDDEILYSRRAGGQWTREARIHADNPHPDITPWAARDAKGNVHVAWSGFDGTSYQVRWSVFDGTAWSAPVVVSPGTGAATLPRVVGGSRFESSFAGRAGACPPPCRDEVVVLWNQYDGKRSVPGAVSVGAGRPAALDVPASVSIPLSERPAASVRGGLVTLALPDGGSLRPVVLGRPAAR